MQCPRCPQENPPQAKFCRGCGMRLSPKCAQCGTELTAQDRFCMECGLPVDAAAVPPPQPAAPEAYTPSHLAILSAPPGLGLAGPAGYNVALGAPTAQGASGAAGLI